MPSKKQSPQFAGPSDVLKPPPVPWVPHGYQKTGIKFLLEHAAAALFWDPGLGKSSTVLAMLKILKQKEMLGKVLLVAPLRVAHNVWPAEVEKWTDFRGLKVAVLHGKDKDERLAEDADVYVINPEGLPWLLGAETETARGHRRVSVDVRRFKQLGFEVLVIDELTKFKHTNTARFKMLKQVIHTFRRRIGLTGSPAANGLMDLFGQCYVLDEGRTLGRFITHYRQKYFTPSFDGFSWDLREGADKEIYERIAPLALRMAAEDHLDLPELVENVIRVDLPPAAMKVYDAVEEDLLAKIEDRVVVAANAGAASGKCRQIANGAVYADPELAALGVLKVRPMKEWVPVHDAKLDALEDLVEELQGSPLLVGYSFDHDLARIRERLGKSTPYIGGGVSAAEGGRLVRLWNAGKLPVLLAHPASVAHGLNLQDAGNHVCFFSPTWNYEEDDQFIRRVYRQGNKARRVFVHRIVARKTVDELVLSALRAKAAGQQALFDALKKLRRSRR